ncbi:MAG: PQQ-dependent sugar dehydrogenase [Pseudomonadota bacterium]
MISRARFRGPLAALCALPALALAAPATAQDEEPFWAKGRPDTETAMQMAPIPAPPVSTARADLPELSVPEGFEVEVFADGVLDARAMAEGADGTVYVSSLFTAGKIYALTGEPGDMTLHVIDEELMLPSGIAWRDGDLYVATPKEIRVYRGIDGSLEEPPEPEVVHDDMPGDVPHGWKFLAFGPEGRLHFDVGAPCNICDPSEAYLKIFSIAPDGTDRQVVAGGVRSTVSFDFHPQTGELWFTDNRITHAQ